MMKYLLALPLGLSLVACSHNDSAKPAAAATTPSAHSGAHHTPHRFTVRHFEGAETQPTDEVGILTVDDHGQMTVESADGINASKLREAVAKLNESAEVDSVPRSDAGFFDAERAHLRKYYGFELKTL